MPEDGLLAGRLGALRTLDRGRGAPLRDRDTVELRLAGDPELEPSLPPSPIDIAPCLDAVCRAAVVDLEVARGVVDLEVVDLEVARGRLVDLLVDRRTVVASMVGFADCMVLAAVISAFAAVVIALVAVFIDCIAEDIVFADAVAFVAAAVILVAADVTFVAADDTPLAAVAGVVPLRLDVLRRAVVLRVVPTRLEVLRRPAAGLRVVPVRLAVVRPAAVLRVELLRRAAGREVVARAAVDRDAVLRVDRDAVLRVVDRAAVLRAGLAAELRLADDLADDVEEPDMDFDRLAVPRDALRLAGLLRAELAELRRVAARVVD